MSAARAILAGAKAGAVRTARSRANLIRPRSKLAKLFVKHIARGPMNCASRKSSSGGREFDQLARAMIYIRLTNETAGPKYGQRQRGDTFDKLARCRRVSSWFWVPLVRGVGRVSARARPLLGIEILTRCQKPVEIRRSQ